MKLYKVLVIVAVLIASSIAGVVFGTSISQDKIPVPSLPIAELANRIIEPTATPTPTPAIPPKQLQISKLGITTPVEIVGLDDKRRMDVPKDPNNVAWYQYGAVPGQIGNSVVAGHLDSTTGPAVFYELNTLEIGDQVTVTDQQGKVQTFRVVQKATYPDADFPIQQVFGPTDKARLNLITCEGTFNQQARNYSHRTVVYTELVK